MSSRTLEQPGARTESVDSVFQTPEVYCSIYRILKETFKMSGGGQWVLGETPKTPGGGQGVERTFQTHSPMIDSIKVKRKGDVRQAKLFYLRERSGKSARIKERLE